MMFPKVGRKKKSLWQWPQGFHLHFTIVYGQSGIAPFVSGSLLFLKVVNAENMQTFVTEQRLMKVTDLHVPFLMWLLWLLLGWKELWCCLWK